MRFIYYDCPFCEQRQKIEETYRGQVVPCYSCSGQVIVPTPCPIPPPPAADPSEAAGIAAWAALLGPALVLATGGAWIGKRAGEVGMLLGAVVGLAAGVAITIKYGELLANLGYWLIVCCGLFLLVAGVLGLAISLVR